MRKETLQAELKKHNLQRNSALLDWLTAQSDWHLIAAFTQRINDVFGS